MAKLTVNLTSGMRDRLRQYVDKLDVAPEERKKYEAVELAFAQIVHRRVLEMFHGIQDVIRDFHLRTKPDDFYVLTGSEAARMAKDYEGGMKAPWDFVNKRKCPFRLGHPQITVKWPETKRYRDSGQMGLVVSDEDFEVFKDLQTKREAWKHIECEHRKAYYDLIKRTRTVNALEEIWPGAAAIAGEPQVAIVDYNPASIVRNHQEALKQQEAE